MKLENGELAPGVHLLEILSPYNFLLFDPSFSRRGGGEEISRFRISKESLGSKSGDYPSPGKMLRKICVTFLGERIMMRLDTPYPFGKKGS